MIIKLHPAGPWRIGPDSGDRDRVDRIYHSDTLYSAVCGAMQQLGLLEEWLNDTARAAQPSVRFSSCFPFHGDTLYVVPPRSHWPLPPSPKVRWKGARFVPLSLVRDLLQGSAVDADGWAVDGPSECLIAQGTQGPYRVAVRSSAAVDRVGVGSVAPHSSACLEFAPGAGLWFEAHIADEKWKDRLLGAIRLLGDSGFGGERSRGWGHAHVTTSDEPLIPIQDGGSAWWMLSLYHPATGDAVDWQRGDYAVTTRGGRAIGTGEMKKSTRMIAEGSVLVAESAPVGAATDVAPEDFPHPVYRYGIAFAIRVPVKQREPEPKPKPAVKRDNHGAPTSNVETKRADSEAADVMRDRHGAPTSNVETATPDDAVPPEETTEALPPADTSDETSTAPSDERPPE